jgi:hypothetical protein
MPRPTLSTDEILDVLRTTPRRLRQMAAGVAEPLLHAAPEPGQWSVNEVLAHLRSCSDVWGEAIERILEDRPVSAINPRTWIKSTDYPELEFAPSLLAFTSQRERHYSRLDRLSERDWSRTAAVAGAGKPLERSVHFYGSWWARHERSHWRQLEKTIRTVRG